jgi:hypothetical protein
MWAAWNQIDDAGYGCFWLINHRDNPLFAKLEAFLRQ